MSEENILKYFTKFGQISSSVIRVPDISSVTVLSEDKRRKILNHKYAFICYKEFDDAMRAVSIVSYYRINDEDYNMSLNHLVEMLKKLEDTIDPKYFTNKDIFTNLLVF